MTLTLFDIPDHKHNNAESEKQFKEHKGHFNNQCQVVYDYLMDGGNLDVIKAMTELRIVDLRRRIADLKEQGVLITDDKIQGGHGAKFWYMTFADKFHNKQKFNK
jgi:hypothetical protein